jgi:hypothetical protein
MLEPLARALTPMAWLAATAALAQPLPAPAAKDQTLAPLVVEAAPKPSTAHEQASRFVHAYAAVSNPGVDQISRWRVPVCVVVFGLPRADQAARIKARIETMAGTLGLRAAREGCQPNVAIAFTDNPQAEMDLIAKGRSHLLGYYHRTSAQQLKTVTHPIQAWYVTATRNDGVNTAGVVAAGLKYDGIEQEGEVVDDPEHRPPPGCISRLTSCYTSVFRSVLIIADNKRIGGAKLGLVADDMLMLALSQPASLDGCNALPSVIDRFANSPCPGRDPPGGLTPADTAYLTALYSADLSGNKNFEQSDIAGRMAKILAVKAKADDAAGAAISAPP